MENCSFCRSLSQLLLVLLFVASDTGVARAEPPDIVLPADTSSPRSTLLSLVDVCNEFQTIRMRDHYINRDSPTHSSRARKLLDCVDTRELPEFARTHGAVQGVLCIKEILDRTELPPIEEIPDEEMLQESEDRLTEWQIPGTRLRIVYIEDGPHRYEYQFSAKSLENAIDDYNDFLYLPTRSGGLKTSPGLYAWYLNAPGDPAIAQVVQRLPRLFRTNLWGQALWKWIGTILVLVVGSVVILLLYHFQRQLTNKIKYRRPYLNIFTIVFPIAAVLTTRAIRHAIFAYVSLRGEWLYRVGFAVNVLTLLTAVILVFSLVNRVSMIISVSSNFNPKGLDAQFARIISRLVGLVVAVIVFLEGGQYLGFPVTTLLASAGVGGFAVALAAQDTLKNLFGTLVLMADKPFRVGERIVASGYDGIVEDIGLRSTRIRMLNGHQVTLPNDQLACSDIENIGRRPFIKRTARIEIPLQVRREKVEAAVSEIRRLLDGHEGMADDMPPRVHFADFDNDAFVISILYWYHPAEYWKFLDFSERVNLEIMQVFEEEGIEFSMPTRIAAVDSHSGKPIEPPSDS